MADYITLGLYVEKSSVQLMKKIERNLRDIFRKNFGKRLDITLEDTGYKNSYDDVDLDEILVCIYPKDGYRLYAKTIIEVLGGVWAYHHLDKLENYPEIRCKEEALWSKLWDCTPPEDVVIHKEIVRAKIRNFTYSFLPFKKELLPLSWLKAGRTDPEVPAKMYVYVPFSGVSKIVFPENPDDLGSTDTIRVWCE